MSRQLQVVGALRPRFTVSHLGLKRREVSNITVASAVCRRAISSSAPSSSNSIYKIREWMGAVKQRWDTRASVAGIAATSSAAVTETPALLTDVAQDLTQQNTPPSNVLEDIARSLPESSLYNSFKYDVTGDAPYPLWFLDPNGNVYPHIISLARHASSVLEAFHDFSGAPWWLTVVLGGIAVRVAVLPATIYSLRNASRAADATADITTIRKAYTRAVSRLGSGMDAQQRLKLVMTAKRGIVAALEKANCHPWRSLAMPFVQIPIVISGILGARHSILTGNEAFETQGALWFGDLTVPDPLYALPMVSLGLTYLTLETIFGSGKSGASTSGAAAMMGAGLGNTIKSAFQISLILSSPFLMELPAGLYLLMITNSLWTMGYLKVVRSPAVYKMLTGREPPTSNKAGMLNPAETPAPAAPQTPPATAAPSPAPSAGQVTPTVAALSAGEHEGPPMSYSSKYTMVVPTSAARLAGAPQLQAGYHTRPAMTDTVSVAVPAAPVQASVAAGSTLSEHAPVIAFPQFVAVEPSKTQDLEQMQQLIDEKLHSAMRTMNSQWPLLSGTANPFMLRIAGGEAAAPWYVAPPQPAAVKAPARAQGSSKLARQIVSAVQSAIQHGRGKFVHADSSTGGVCSSASRHFQLSSPVPENAGLRINAHHAAWSNQMRTYYGHVGSVVYGIDGPVPVGKTVLGPNDTVEAIPHLLECTLAGRYRREMESKRTFGLADNGSGGGGNERGNGAPDNGGGASQNGNGDDRSGSGDGKMPPVAAIAEKRVAGADSDGYAAGASESSTDQSTDSDFSSPSDGDSSGTEVAVAGRSRRRYLNKPIPPQQSKRHIVRTLLGAQEGKPALPEVSKRLARKWMGILKVTSLGVRPSVRDRIRERSAEAAQARVRAPAAAAQEAHTMFSLQADRAAATESSQQLHDLDVAAELTKIAFPNSEKADTKSSSDGTVDDDTMRLILGSHFHSWEQDEIKAGRREVKKADPLPVVIDVETVNYPKHADDHLEFRNSEVEVVRGDPGSPSKKSSMKGVVLEDGTYIEDGKADGSHDSSQDRKGLDLAGLLRGADMRSVGSKAMNETENETDHTSTGVNVTDFMDRSREETPRFSQDALDIPDLQADIADYYASAEDILQADVSLGYANQIAPGSAAVPSEDDGDSTDSHQTRLAQLKQVASKFADSSRHLPPARRRRQHHPHLHETLTFERNARTKQVGAVSKLVFAGLAPTSVPFTLDVESKRNREADAHEFLQRIAHAISGSPVGMPPGVFKGDASIPTPVYDEVEKQDGIVHKRGKTFTKGGKHDGSQSDSD